MRDINRTTQHAEHRRGIALALGGVLILSPDGLLIRLISTDDWTLLFWRGLLTSASLWVALVCLHRKSVWQHFLAIRRTGLFAAGIQAAGTILFVLAITHTSVSNTLIILGVTPLWAAIYGRLFLSEKIHLRTKLAIPAALLGIYITANAEISANTGDLYAICASLFVGARGVIVRSAKSIDMTPSLVIGGLLIAAIGLLRASPLSVTAHDAVYFAILGCIVLPLSFGLLIAAPRYIPAHEVNLILLLEMALGSYWVWMILGEHPTHQALIGGSIVLITLMTHTYLGFRNRTT